jgi:hypothetical protein
MTPVRLPELPPLPVVAPPPPLPVAPVPVLGDDAQPAAAATPKHATRAKILDCCFMA